MMARTLLASCFFLALLTGCGSTPTENLRSRADAREEGLRGVSISQGACDGVGQYIPRPGDGMSLEASAAPAH